MVAQTEQHGLATCEGARLKDRVPVAFLRALLDELDAVAQPTHLVRFAPERCKTVQSSQICIVGTCEVMPNRGVLTWLNDQTNLFDARCVELDQVIVKQRARDAVGADDR